MTGEYTLHEPGERVPVTVEADGSGNIPTDGDLVAIVGESQRGVHVSLPSAAGEGVALLMRLPFDADGKSADPDATYDANEVIGESMAKLRHPVDWCKVSDGETFAAGDLAVSDAGGTVAAYDSAGGDTVDFILGPVWTTLQRSEGTAGKVAVVRHR